MKFLIDDGSLQNYARQETFNERYVSQSHFYHEYKFPILLISDSDLYNETHLKSSSDETAKIKRIKEK